jgi:hypothetical protein
MELVVTRHAWAKGLTADEMQSRLRDALDADRRHLVSVHENEAGESEITFGRELGDVRRAFIEAAEAAPKGGSN